MFPLDLCKESHKACYAPRLPLTASVGWTFEKRDCPKAVSTPKLSKYFGILVPKGHQSTHIFIAEGIALIIQAAFSRRSPILIPAQHCNGNKRQNRSAYTESGMLRARKILTVGEGEHFTLKYDQPRIPASLSASPSQLFGVMIMTGHVPKLYVIVQISVDKWSSGLCIVRVGATFTRP